MTVPPPARAIPVVVFLSGSRRGTMLRLGGEQLCIGTDPRCEVRIPMDTEPLPLPHHATLGLRGDTYEITVSPGAEVWVNGEPVEHMVLASGDVLEIGRDGAVLRFRLYEPGSQPYKTLPEVFADTFEFARGESGMVRKAGRMAMSFPVELATRTSRLFRGAILLALLALGTTTSLLAWRSVRLEARLGDEIQRVEGLSALIEGARRQWLSSEDLGDVLTELRSTTERVDSLEAAGTATARVIAEAARATVFIQGGYQFVQPESGRPLRMVLGPDGEPLRNMFGHPALSLDGDGPVLEIFVTGTGFVATTEGQVLTNRHVALPWEYDDAAERLLMSGFRAEWRRFVGYLPGIDRPVALRVILAADDADLTVLEPAGVSASMPYVRLAARAPSAGDPIVVLGYPLGLRALLARSDADFVARLQAEGVEDFYAQAERVARAGFMHPLATRGIVGQVTGASVVYDAETTSGGSGGPVLTLQGEVVAVNAAVLPEFGGSNLGVPAERARALLDRASGN